MLLQISGYNTDAIEEQIIVTLLVVGKTQVISINKTGLLKLIVIL
jgi:hypothetical protein